MRTRIIATVGPACADIKTLAEMIQAGVSVFRFNFSHAMFQEHERMLERVRKAERRSSSRRVAILQDLAGPRIRTGWLAGGKLIQLKPGQRFVLYRQPVPGGPSGVSLDYPGPFTHLHRHQMIYVDDGNIHLQVLKAQPNRLATRVMQEGLLGERKGVNIPGAPLDFPLISEKDIRDLEFAVKHRVEYVAQSFVRDDKDVIEVKRRLAGRAQARVIAKIENRDGIKNIAEILRAADGIMVARGDLGISVPIYEIPILQKWIIAACNHRRKPVITATQMLEHMIDHPLPTRAEVSDVANAVIDGSDFVMLSGETATGRDPVAAVRMMATIIQHTERHAPFRGVRRTR